MAFDTLALSSIGRGTNPNDGTGDDLRAGALKHNNNATAIQAATNALARAANAGQLQGFKNKLINGDFRIWQRGTSGAGGGYAADRWKETLGSTWARSTDVPSVGTFQYSAEFAHSGADVSLLDQAIEAANAIDCVGKKMRLSLWAKNVAGSGNALIAQTLYANATDNFSGVTAIDSITLSASPSGSWTFYEGTFAAVPAGGANGLLLRIRREATNANTTRIAGVQLEPCDTTDTDTSPFEHRPIGLEQMLCERYYERIEASASAFTEFALGQCISTTVARGRLGYRTRKRTTPSVAIVGAAAQWSADASNGAQTAGAAVAATFVGPDSCEIEVTVASGLTAGNASVIRANNSTAPAVAISAEL